MRLDLLDVEKNLDWLKRKLNLDWKSKNSNPLTPKRGQAFSCDLGIGVGREIQKIRPVVVVQNNIGNLNSSTITVVSITHTYKELPSFVAIETQVGRSGGIILDGYVNVATIRSVDKARLYKYISSIPASEMKEIDTAIARNLDLNKSLSTLENKYNDKLLYIEKLKEKIARLEAKEFVGK